MIILGAGVSLYRGRGTKMPLKKVNANIGQRNACKYAKDGCQRKIGPFAIPGSGGTGGSSGSFTSDVFNEFRSFDANDYRVVQDRPVRELGRCDNQRFVEMSGTRGISNKNDPRNVCVDMSLTPNIEWKVDPSKNNPEWMKLPPAIRQLIAKFNIIVIPFKIDGNTMHPDCGRAYYKNDPKKRPVVFLEDNGGSCRLKDVSPNKHYEKMRHKDAALDDWSNVEFVSCGAGETGGQCGKPLGRG